MSVVRLGYSLLAITEMLLPKIFLPDLFFPEVFSQNMFCRRTARDAWWNTVFSAYKLQCGEEGLETTMYVILYVCMYLYIDTHREEGHAVYSISEVSILYYIVYVIASEWV